MRTLVKGDLRFQPFKVLKIILNRINHNLAWKNIKKFPQLAIFSFDHIGLSINLYGRYESESLNLIGKFIEEKIPNYKQKTALDIGANIGNHSLFFSKYFEKVFAFEPNPLAYELLKINATYASSIRNITPNFFGLSDEKGKLNFKINPKNIGGSRILADSELDANNRNQITIDVDRADALTFLSDAQIGLIKIDIEGHEIFALKGAEKIIRRNKPVVIFEQGVDEIENSSSEVILYLRSLDYEFYVMERRFNIGIGQVSKVLSLGLSTVFGERLSLVSASEFDKRFYDMIVAVPRSSQM